MKKRYQLLIFICITILASHCITIPRSATASSTPLEGKVISKNLGKAEGSDVAWSVLFFSLGYPDIDKAIDQAVQSKNGDALINVRMYEQDAWFLLAAKTKVIITGDVIKFQPKIIETETKKKKR